jgi:rod shape-determining protein MreC
MSPGRKPNIAAVTLSPTGLMQRFSFLLLVLAALALLAISLLKPAVGDSVRARMTDVFAPALGAIAGPVAKLTETITTLGSLTELRAENERLKEDNRHLREYQTALMRLEAENKGLRDLLKMPADPVQRLTTTRVVADVGGPFMRNVVVLAGTSEGLRNGLVALSGGGLAGRIVSAGSHSSRVLLINDINARVPVLIERSRHRAMLAGDNSAVLQLVHIPPDVRVAVGDRLITSGVGGIYPAGLPVGVVSAVDGSAVRVEPLADLDRLELVHILDPGTPANLLSPESAQPAAPPRRP